MTIMDSTAEGSIDDNRGGQCGRRTPRDLEEMFRDVSFGPGGLSAEEINFIRCSLLKKPPEVRDVLMKNWSYLSDDERKKALLIAVCGRQCDLLMLVQVQSV